MSEIVQQSTTEPVKEEPKSASAGSQQKMTWETPKMEDVSDQVMAQPYIRFT